MNCNSYIIILIDFKEIVVSNGLFQTNIPITLIFLEFKLLNIIAVTFDILFFLVNFSLWAMRLRLILYTIINLI